MSKILNLLIVLTAPAHRFENSQRKLAIKQITNDQNPPLYRIDVFFWKDEATSEKHFLKMVKTFQPGFIVLEGFFLQHEVETIEKIIETHRRYCLKEPTKLKLFQVSTVATIKTPGIKIIPLLSDITRESL